MPLDKIFHAFTPWIENARKPKDSTHPCLSNQNLLYFNAGSELSSELVDIATLFYIHYGGTINYHSDLNHINLRLLVQMEQD